MESIGKPSLDEKNGEKLSTTLVSLSFSEPNIYLYLLHYSCRHAKEEGLWLKRHL